MKGRGAQKMKPICQSQMTEPLTTATQPNTVQNRDQNRIRFGLDTF